MSDRDARLTGTGNAIVGVAGLLLLALNTVVEAYVAVVLWGWSLVQMGVPPLPPAAAVALAGLAGIWTHQGVYDPDKRGDLTAAKATRALAEGFGRGVVGPFLFLGIAAAARAVLS